MRLTTIWVGDDSKRPDKWINTWKEKHPHLEHYIFNNDDLFGRTWKNQKLIDLYLERKDYPGVADVMRYEILLEEETFIHPADSICLHPIDELIEQNEIITVYENEVVREGLISPVYYAKKWHPFVQHLVDNLPDYIYDEDGNYLEPWANTGNLYMQKSYELKDWGFTPLPSWTFTPVHYTGETYTGDGKVYAKQTWGSTLNTY